jgi:hypothetical protein
MLGFERDGVDPGIGGLLGLPFEAELVSERIERSFGRCRPTPLPAVVSAGK